MDIKFFVDTDADVRILRRIMRDVKGAFSGLGGAAVPPPSSPCTSSLWSSPKATPTSLCRRAANAVALDMIIQRVKSHMEQE